MSEKPEQWFETIVTMLQTITEQINQNGKATQSQIDEVKTGIYALEERVTQLESAKKKQIVNSSKPICKNEIEQIVREVMHERGVVFGRNEFGTVLNKEARFIAATHNSSHDGVGFDFEICCTKCDIQLPGRYKIELCLGKDGEIKFTRDDRELASSKWNLRR